MATYEVQAFMNSNVGVQKVRVDSNTIHGAVQQVEQIYNPDFIENIREVNDNGGGGSDSSLGDYGFKFALLGIVIVIGLILPFLPYIIVFGAIGLICWGVYKFIKWILK